MTSRMITLLVSHAQAVIAGRVGAGWIGHRQDRGDLRRLGAGLQPSHDVDNVFHADAPGGGRRLQHQIGGHQHRLQPGCGHQSQHLGHEPVAPVLPQQRLAQLLQGLGQIGKRRAVAQRPGFALNQRHIVLPVVGGQPPVGQPGMAGHTHAVMRHDHLGGIHPGAHPPPGEFTGHGVTIAGNGHQTGAADLDRVVHIAVERCRHGHEVGLLVLEHLGHGELAELGMEDLLPQGPAAHGQPGVEFGKGAPGRRQGLNPHTSPAVLDVLLHHPLLPTGSDVAEVGVEQVVAAHRRKARVDVALLARVHFVDGRLHVVIDAAMRHSAEGGKPLGMGVKQHLVTLAGIGPQPEGTAGAQLDVGNLHAVRHAAHHHALFTPVELEGFAQRKRQGHEGVHRARAIGLSPGAQ